MRKGWKNDPALLERHERKVGERTQRIINRMAMEAQARHHDDRISQLRALMQRNPALAELEADR